MGQPRPLFVYFRSFQTQILQKKTVGVSGIRTRIVWVAGKHADHLTTTPAHFSVKKIFPWWELSGVHLQEQTTTYFLFFRIRWPVNYFNDLSLVAIIIRVQVNCIILPNGRFIQPELTHFYVIIIIILLFITKVTKIFFHLWGLLCTNVFLTSVRQWHMRF